jgi:hypothetical protein
MRPRQSQLEPQWRECAKRSKMRQARAGRKMWLYGNERLNFCRKIDAMTEIEAEFCSSFALLVVNKSFQVRHEFSSQRTASINHFVDLVLNSRFTLLYNTATSTDKHCRLSPFERLTARLNPQRGEPVMVAKARSFATFPLYHVT